MIDVLTRLLQSGPYMPRANLMHYSSRFNTQYLSVPWNAGHFAILPVARAMAVNFAWFRAAGMLYFVTVGGVCNTWVPGERDTRHASAARQHSGAMAIGV